MQNSCLLALHAQDSLEFLAHYDAFENPIDENNCTADDEFFEGAGKEANLMDFVFFCCLICLTVVGWPALLDLYLSRAIFFLLYSC